MRARCLFIALLLVGCNKAGKPADGGRVASESEPAKVASDQVPDGFVPLRSAEVQAAIHRALRTRQNQRWQDGPWSGYAVPSLQALPNGCRTIRYTVDQQPDAPPTTINACDTSTR